MLGAVLLFAGSLQAQYVLPIQKATASSEMRTSNAAYTADRVTDDSRQTWWTPAAPNSNGSNQWLRIYFDGPTEVTGVEILGGSHYPNYPNYGDLWKLNHRLKAGVLVFEDGSQVEFELPDEDEIQTISFASRTTSYIELRPRSVYNGSKWSDLCISWFKGLGNDSMGDLGTVLDEMVGIYVVDDDGCNTDAVWAIYRDEDGFQIIESYLMDAVNGYIVSIEEGNRGSVSFQVKYSLERDDTFELLLPGEAFQIAGEVQQQMMREGEMPDIRAAASEYFRRSVLEGVYTNRSAMGPRVIIREATIDLYSTDGEGSQDLDAVLDYNFTIDTMAEGPEGDGYCIIGEVYVEESDSEFVVIRRGRNLEFWRTAYYDDGPGSYVAEDTPWMVLIPN